MNVYEYHLKILKNSKLSVPTKEEADRRWNDLVPCPKGKKSSSGANGQG